MTNGNKDVLRDLGSFLAPHLPERLSDAHFDFSLTDLGIDSFLLMEMVLFAEREYGVRLPLARVAQSNTLRDLASVVQESIVTREPPAP